MRKDLSRKPEATRDGTDGGRVHNVFSSSSALRLLFSTSVSQAAQRPNQCEPDQKPWRFFNFRRSNFHPASRIWRSCLESASAEGGGRKRLGKRLGRPRGLRMFRGMADATPNLSNLRMRVPLSAGYLNGVFSQPQEHFFPDSSLPHLTHPSAASETLLPYDLPSPSILRA